MIWFLPGGKSVVAALHVADSTAGALLDETNQLRAARQTDQARTHMPKHKRYQQQTDLLGQAHVLLELGNLERAAGQDEQAY